jgi:hypothetical protein
MYEYICAYWRIYIICVTKINKFIIGSKPDFVGIGETCTCASDGTSHQSEETFDLS